MCTHMYICANRMEKEHQTMHVSKKKLNGRSLVASGRINPFVISYVNYLDLILTYMSLWCDW